MKHAIFVDQRQYRWHGKIVNGSVRPVEVSVKDLTLEGVADKIECPILVVHGEHDTIVPVEIARAPPTAAPPKPAEATPPFSSNIKWDWQLPGPGDLAQARKKVV